MTSLPGVPATPPTGTAVPIATQITQFLAAGAGESEGVLRRVGRRERHLLPAGPRASRRGHARAGAGWRSGSPRPACCRRSVRCNAGGARYITVFNLPDIGKTPGGSRLRSGGIDQRAVVAVQHDVVRRARCDGIPDDPRQHVRLLQRGSGEPGRVRIREHRPARRADDALAPLHVGELRHADARRRRTLRRRRAPDDRGTRGRSRNSCNR